MLKSIPSLKGTLQAALTDAATVMQVDSDTAGLLRKRLSTGDWAYARLSDGSYVEVIRITAVEGTLATIERGIDGTDSLDFGWGTRIEHTVPIQATTDIINEVLTTGVELTGSGAAIVTKTGDYSWNIHANKMQVVSHHPGVEVTNVYPTIFITKK